MFKPVAEEAQRLNGLSTGEIDIAQTIAPIDIAAVVVSESEGSAASLEETAAAIAQFADAIDLVAVPRLATATSEHAAFAQIAGLLSGSF